MRHLSIALWLVAAAPAWAQETPEDLKRQIAEKRQELSTQKEWAEDFRLRRELRDLWDKLLGPTPHTLIIEATVPYTFWDHDLDIADGAGIGLNVIVPTRAWIDEESGITRRGSIVPLSFELGVRRWWTRDERASGDVDVVSYRLLANWLDELFPEGFGWGASFSFGLTRFASHAPGGDHDTGLDVAINLPHLTVALGRSFRLAASLEWDIMRTSFNQDRTRTVFGLAPLISIEYSF